MKTLLLMRHAKSSWKDTELPDMERPLNKRGKNDAPMIGKLIFERELVPQCVLCSTALRARQTAEELVNQSGFKGDVQYLDALYLAEPGIYLEALNTLPDEMERVLVIGHNPGIEGLVQILSGVVESLPTAALACISLPIQSWKELNSETQGELMELWRPGEMKKTAEKAGREKKEKKEKDGKKEKEREKTPNKDKKKAKK